MMGRQQKWQIAVMFSVLSLPLKWMQRHHLFHTVSTSVTWRTFPGALVSLRPFGVPALAFPFSNA